MTNTELNSPLMDELESTRAAEPVLDATEPAPSANETESIYAWSHADDDDTVVFHRRSWKLPLAAALLAIAAVTTVGVVKVWPHHSTPGSPAAPAASPAVMPAPAPAPVPVSPDVLFVNTLNDGMKGVANYVPTSQGDATAIAMGHDMCVKMSVLYQADRSSAYGELIHQAMVGTGIPETVAAAIVRSSVVAYCPQYGS